MAAETPRPPFTYPPPAPPTPVTACAAIKASDVNYEACQIEDTMTDHISGRCADAYTSAERRSYLCKLCACRLCLPCVSFFGAGAQAAGEAAVAALDSGSAAAAAASAAAAAPPDEAEAVEVVGVEVVAPEAAADDGGGCTSEHSAQNDASIAGCALWCAASQSAFHCSWCFCKACSFCPKY